MSHTPGPWTYGRMHSDEFGDFFVRGGSLLDIAHVGSVNDALLIAAAPDLLEALKNLWKEIAKYASIAHEGCELLEIMSDARAAIAKAEGK